MLGPPEDWAELETNKSRIVLLVSILPGLHLRALQRLSGLSFNSTRYHVLALTKSGKIVRSEQGGYSRLYPAGMSENDKTLYSILRTTTDRKILQTISKSNCITSGDLCGATGLAKSTISEHIAKLIQRGVVRPVQTTSNRVGYQLVDPQRMGRLISEENDTRLRKATDRFIDLWNF